MDKVKKVWVALIADPKVRGAAKVFGIAVIASIAQALGFGDSILALIEGF